MVGQLVGRLVLVVEDEPLVALDVADCLKAAGAQVVIARTLADALRESASADLSAAVLDHGLHDGDTSEVCERLKNEIYRSWSIAVTASWRELAARAS